MREKVIKIFAKQEIDFMNDFMMLNEVNMVQTKKLKSNKISFFSVQCTKYSSHINEEYLVHICYFLIYL